MLPLAPAGVAWAQVEAAPGQTVEVVGPRPRVVTPLPGVVLDRERTSVNVQSATARDIKAAQSLTLTDFLQGQMQSVNVLDYQGNPFQQDLMFRGFSASPLIGTPQGVSVWLDGVRVNEPFGEVVNWDLLPLAAIERMDLMPGSSPLFGLNTLGGALALTTKSGFTAPRTEATLMGGPFGRRQTQLATGGHNGTVAGFLAFNAFDEQGWRDNSPSHVRQAFGRWDWHGDGMGANVALVSARNRLVGNGMVPLEDYERRPQTVFTSPDLARNDLKQGSMQWRMELGSAGTLVAQAYRRVVFQDSMGGDFWDEFRTAASRLRPDCPSGVGVADGAIGVDLPGCPGLLPNGVFNIGSTRQWANGGLLQFSWAGTEHQLVLGASYDRNRVEFQQGQRLGFITDTREVVLAPERFDDLGLTALQSEIRRNDLHGGAAAASVFVQDTWTPQPGLHLTGGLRWNWARVTNQLVADRPIPLYQFDVLLARRLQNRCGAESNDIRARWYCTSGDYSYRSTNPSLGLSWLPRPGLNLLANASRGTRVPSTIELGCARDREAERLAGGGRNTGRTPGCSIPTALSADPYLPQVVAHNVELGLRGAPRPGLTWNASVYRSDLYDDILFVSLGSRNRGVFDTFGRTRRQGFELGLQGQFGPHGLRMAWSRVDATFESPAEIVNLSNSSSSKEVGKVNTFLIAPGDRIPGVPRDSLRLAWDWQPHPAWRLGLGLTAHSGSWVRGNDNNDHQAGGTDSNGIPTQGTLDPTITTEPGRRYVGPGRTPGWAVFNLTASVRLAKGLELNARVDNLFNRRYVTAGELGLNPFTTSRWGARDASGFNFNSNDWTHSTLVGPGAPRTVQLSLVYTLDHLGS